MIEQYTHSFSQIYISAGRFGKFINNKYDPKIMGLLIRELSDVKNNIRIIKIRNSEEEYEKENENKENIADTENQSQRFEEEDHNGAVIICNYCGTLLNSQNGKYEQYLLESKNNIYNIYVCGVCYEEFNNYNQINNSNQTKGKNGEGKTKNKKSLQSP